MKPISLDVKVKSQLRPQKAHAVDAYVSEKILQARTSSRVSQQALGAAMGEQGAGGPVGYQQVQKYETGAARVPAGRLWQIAMALGIGIEKLFPAKAEELEEFNERTNPKRPERSER